MQGLPCIVWAASRVLTGFGMQVLCWFVQIVTCIDMQLLRGVLWWRGGVAWLGVCMWGWLLASAMGVGAGVHQCIQRVCYRLQDLKHCHWPGGQQALPAQQCATASCDSQPGAARRWRANAVACWCGLGAWLGWVWVGEAGYQHLLFVVVLGCIGADTEVAAVRCIDVSKICAAGPEALPADLTVSVYSC